MNTYQAIVAYKTAGGYQCAKQQRALSDLPDNDVLIAVNYSALNFKDALSGQGNKGVTKQYPHQLGIDATGVVKSSRHASFKEGDEVIVTGYDLGMNTSGGLAELISVPSEWVIAKPKNLKMAESMLLGTAGLTAMLLVNKLLKAGVEKTQGPILVTGATGGVGSFAVAILADLGFSVTALTGKKAESDYLSQLGASEVLLRDDWLQKSPKPLLKAEFAGAIDVAGGETLAHILKCIKPEGAVACCGLADSADLPTSVLPFILRGISLCGVDSVEIPLKTKAKAWQHLAELSHECWHKFEAINTTISLDDVPQILPLFGQGKVRGHYRVKI